MVGGRIDLVQPAWRLVGKRKTNVNAGNADITMQRLNSARIKKGKPKRPSFDE